MKITSQKQVRAAFWQAGYPNISRKKIRYGTNGLMIHDTNTRCAFVDFVDSLSRDKIISPELASKVTL
jgi:hypothetical protein